MAVDEFEVPKLDRRMYGHRPEVAEVEQTNDVDGPFVNSPVGIPADLQAMIQDAGRLEVEPEPEKEVSHDVDQIAEENPNSRFRILNLAIKKPGVCFVCRSDGNDERQFVDFGKTVEWYGVVYICTFCVAEVAKILGFAAPNEKEAYKNSILVNDEAFGNVLSENESLQEQLNASRVLLRNCRCSDGDSGDSVTYPVQVDVESSSESEPNSDDADESGDVKELGDVPEASVDNDGELEPEKPKRTRRGSSSS